MDRDQTAMIAEQVSIMMQLDRTRHHVPTEIDTKAMANVPAYIASVFEEANAVGSMLSPIEAYTLINKRVSQIQAQLYLMRIEMENRFTRDPSKIYEDPLAISAYGERIETTTKLPRTFSFGPEILAYGWYPLEQSGDESRRWMRPGDLSVACVPHLGTVDQIVEAEGHLLEAEQLDSLEIRIGDTVAEIERSDSNPKHFVARMTLSAEAIRPASFVSIEFRLNAFRQPNAMDTRLLGANIGKFTIRPVVADAPAQAEADVEKADT